MNLYHSTRSRAISRTSKEAIREGLAPDGGLYVCDALGSEKVEVAGLAEQSYHDIARAVLQLLLPDYTADEIAACVREAYEGTFASPEVTPLLTLGTVPNVMTKGTGLAAASLVATRLVTCAEPSPRATAS